jgi:hypothetical protein
VTIVHDWESLSPNLGLNSWIAFSSAVHHEAILTAELILLPDEVDSVMSIALDAGLEVTGLAQSSVLCDRPIYTIDLHGAGTFSKLASAIRSTLNQIQNARRLATTRRAQSTHPILPEESAIAAEPINKALGTRGTVSGGVYLAAIGRIAIFRGEQIGPAMGMSTWISISGTNDHAVANGEVAASPEELQGVLKALRAKGASVTSIRNHTLGEHPQLVFARYWAEGPALDLAKALRFALEVQNGMTELTTESSE